VQSEIGSAPAIARALDQLEHERVVGTLAGDDTVLVVTASERDAKLLARELAPILG
jgi:arginine repressor